MLGAEFCIAARRLRIARGDSENATGKSKCRGGEKVDSSGQNPGSCEIFPLGKLEIA